MSSSSELLKKAATNLQEAETFLKNHKENEALQKFKLALQFYQTAHKLKNVIQSKINEVSQKIASISKTPISTASAVPQKNTNPIVPVKSTTNSKPSLSSQNQSNAAVHSVPSKSSNSHLTTSQPTPQPVPNKLLQEAISVVSQAVMQDSQGKPEAALPLYEQAIKMFNNAIQELDEHHGKLTLEQIVKYVKRKEELQNILVKNSSNINKTPSTNSELEAKEKSELESESNSPMKREISVSEAMEQSTEELKQIEEALKSVEEMDMDSIKKNMKEGQEYSKEVLDHMQYNDSDVDDEELQQELEELEKEVNEGK